MTQILLTFVMGLIAGYLASYVKFVFDAEKSRFDFRTRILREIWEAVLFAKSLATNIDPEMGFADPTEPRKDRIDRRLEEFGKAHVEAKRIVRFNSPFYPVAIHDLANQIVLESELLARHIATTSPNTLQQKYWEIIKKFTNRLNPLTDQLCDAIRQEVDCPSSNPIGWMCDLRKRIVSRQKSRLSGPQAPSKQ